MLKTRNLKYLIPVIAVLATSGFLLWRYLGADDATPEGVLSGNGTIEA